jgi:hypothetical protein
MKGVQGCPIGSANLGGNQIPPVDLNAQGRGVPNIPEEYLRGLFQRHSAHVLLRHAETADQLGIAEIQLALLSFDRFGCRSGHGPYASVGAPLCSQFQMNQAWLNEGDPLESSNHWMRRVRTTFFANAWWSAK